MEAMNGVKILRQDLKMEGDEYQYFKALENTLRKEGIKAKVVFNDYLFDKYDSLLVNTNDELLGEKDGKTEILQKITGAYALAMGMFVSG